MILNIGAGSKQNQTKVNPRKFYDLSKVAKHGRKKIDYDASSGSQTHPFIEELTDWLQTSRHSKDDDSLIYRELHRFKQLYYEEKSKTITME